MGGEMEGWRGEWNRRWNSPEDSSLDGSINTSRQRNLWNPQQMRALLLALLVQEYFTKS